MTVPYTRPKRYSRKVPCVAVSLGPVVRGDMHTPGCTPSRSGMRVRSPLGIHAGRTVENFGRQGRVGVVGNAAFSRPISHQQAR